MSDTEQREQQSRVRGQSRSEWLLPMTLAVGMLGVGTWWYFTASPPTRHISIEPEVELESQRTATSEPAYEQSLSEASGDSAVHDIRAVRALVTTLLAEGAREQAVVEARRWRESVSPNDWRARAHAEYLLGHALMFIEQFDEAEVHLLLAADHASAHPAALESLSAEIDHMLQTLSARHAAEIAETESRTDASGVHVVPVSLSASFRPYSEGASANATPSWLPRNHRLEEVPVFVLEEPSYQGTRQLYGAVKLGTVGKELYSFAFDIPESGNPVLWFDRNANYDLTDDGGPIANQGQGIFAAPIELSMADIVPQTDDSQRFRIWFFTNDTLWSEGFAAHYCTTVLKGKVQLAGRTFDAYIADSGFNEADFTDDGILIDLDDDGRISRPERVPADALLEMAGARYRFDIRW